MRWRVDIRYLPITAPSYEPHEGTFRGERNRINGMKTTMDFYKSRVNFEKFCSNELIVFIRIRMFRILFERIKEVKKLSNCIWTNEVRGHEQRKTFNIFLHPRMLSS